MTERALVLALLAPLLLGAAPEGSCPGYRADRSPYFGDLHVHTTYSLDASTQGTRTTPQEAYRFARGEPIGLHPFGPDGVPLRRARLGRPLDFAAVTDHAELFGETSICRTEGLPGYDSVMCRVYRQWPRLAFFVMNSRGAPRFAFCGDGGVHCREAATVLWADLRGAAAGANRPCEFTSFVAYEWTASGAGASNLHRNVIFASDRVPTIPADAITFPTKEELWAELEEECRAELGCDAVVIPHNSNISGDLMFQAVTSSGAALTAETAAVRAAAEPLVEIMQHKGSSECSRSSASADELCGFEELPYDRFMGRYLPLVRQRAEPMNFTRHALSEGLVLQQTLGANPFKFGLLASTDTHLGTPGLVDEVEYPGHGGAGTPIGRELPPGLIDAVEFNPGGLAAVWAEENTRPALFRALRRREVYGTSGPRIVLRFFAGWSFAGDVCEHSDFPARGYAQGVPMGGELPPPPADHSSGPVLAAWALRDPGTSQEPGLPLQRLQVIKAWVENGKRREAVVEIAGDAKNGADVDPDTCTPRGEGSSQLCAVWRDPEFDANAPALYYVRVIENPRCRWSAQACLARGVDCAEPSTLARGLESCCDPQYPRTIQERAWSSPIWYTPAP